MDQPKKSIFERHPFLTQGVILSVFILILLVATEGFLSFQQGGEARNTSSEKRHLVLREWHPLTDYTFKAPPARFSVDEETYETYQISTDKKGFIKPSKIHDHADLNIVFLGGSTTECMFVDPEKRFPYAMGRDLEESTGLKVNSYNGGRSGNNSMMSLLQLLGKVIPMKPDFVVLMHGVNDIGVLSKPDGYWTEDPVFKLVRQPETGVLPFLLKIRDNTFPLTYRLLKNGIITLKKSLFSEAQAATSEDNGKIFENSLRTFVQSAKNWQIRPVLMTQAILRDTETEHLEGAYISPEALARGGFSKEDFHSQRDYFNAIVRQVALQEKIPLIDLSGEVLWEKSDFYDDLHFSNKGALKASRYISKEIAKYINSD